MCAIYYDDDVVVCCGDVEVSEIEHIYIYSINVYVELCKHIPSCSGDNKNAKRDRPDSGRRE